MTDTNPLDVKQEKHEPAQPLDTPAVPTSTKNESELVIPKKSKNPVAVSIGIIVTILVLLGAGVVGGMALQGTFNKPTSSVSLNPTVDGNTTITQEESSIANVAEKVSPSVVSIVATTQSQYYYNTSGGSAAGTGIIVSKDGYVLTNNHVVEGTSNISIFVSEGN